MNLIPAKTPDFVKSLFPNFIWNIDTNKKELYLTFDDGPTPKITPWVLEQLKKHNAKATFFCIGSNVEKHPEIFKAILEDGHSVGNHTYNHLKGWKHKTKNYLADVEKAQTVLNSKNQKQNSKISNERNSQIDALYHFERSEEYQKQNSQIASSRFDSTQRPIQKIIEYDKLLIASCQLSISLFRPPYGKLKSKQVKQLQRLGYKIVMWDVLSFDWDKSVSKEDCLNNVINSAKKGSIIVFHDSLKAERNLRYVLPKVLEYYSGKGFEFKKYKALV